LRNPESAVAYLRSVVCNLTRMRIRHLQVARRHVARSKTDPTTPGAAVDDGGLREDQRELLDALTELPARQREALVLRYWLDLREAEIAKAMGISAGAVKSHTSRGTAALTRILQRRQDELADPPEPASGSAEVRPPGPVDQYIGPQAAPVPVSRAEGR
jgi:RNA polymerase sigma factor (sigma-70 family)